MSKLNPNDFYDVAVILINYNSSSFTIECITSIIKQTSSLLSFSIVIIDNASQPEDYKNLVRKLQDLDIQVPLKLFRSKINTGFSGGNMLGVQFSSAKYYFFLNNDCHLQNDCLSILFNFCEKKPDTALCSPQLVDENNAHQPCIDYFPMLRTKIFGLGILRLTYGKRFFKRKGIYNTPIQVDIVSGSQMFTRATAFHEVGGLDSTFFLYCEEEDIALRLAKNGYKTFLVPEARNTHLGGGSTNSSLDIKKEFYISFLYFYRKHYGRPKTLLLTLLLFLRNVKKAYKSSDNLKLALFILKGAHLKHSLRHRQKIIENYNLLNTHYMDLTKHEI